jgi:hypothetical protein
MTVGRFLAQDGEGQPMRSGAVEIVEKGWLLNALLFLPVLVCFLTPAPIRAEPLDVADPTPRAIQVELEVSTAPETIGKIYSPPFAATYSASGNTGTVVISAAEYESILLALGFDYFDLAVVASLIIGSASDFTLDIDLTTLEGTAQPFRYQMSITNPVQQIGTVTRNLSTTATAGFGYNPAIPGFPFFCTTCFLVPGAPYDPITGKINAVGSGELIAPDIDLTSFSRAGDLRFSEIEATAVPGLARLGLGGLVVLLIGVTLVVVSSNSRPVRTKRSWREFSASPPTT